MTWPSGFSYVEEIGSGWGGSENTSVAAWHSGTCPEHDLWRHLPGCRDEWHTDTSRPSSIGRCGQPSPGPAPTVVVGAGEGLPRAVFRERDLAQWSRYPPRAASVPFLFYLGKDFGAVACCHPSPFSVRRNCTRSPFSWSVNSSGRMSGSWCGFFTPPLL